jgi:S1-C subfamily serine protease
MAYAFKFDDELFIDVDVLASGMGRAVVPVIFRRGRDARKVRSEGTAFCMAGFTSGDALFVTAGHVAADLATSDEDREPFLLLPNATDPSNLVGVAVAQVALASAYSDVALLVARPADAVVPVAEPNSMRLTFAPPRVGENTMALGYALPPGAGSRITYALKASRGEVIAVHDRRRGGMVDFPAFETTARYEHAMSGGPIIDTDGLVVGIISTGFDMADGETPIGYGACSGALAELKVDLTNDQGKVEELSVARLAEMGLLGTGDVELHLQRDENGVMLSWPTK